MKQIKNIFFSITIAVFIICAVFFDAFKITYSQDQTINRFIGAILPLLFGSVAVCLLLVKNGSGLFKKPKNLLYLIPCLVIAVDNFPFPAFFAGKMELVHTRPIDFTLFALNCVFVGFFEELVFRGVLFALLASIFTKDKKGLLKSYVLSSVIFGVTHLLNIFGGASVPATILQAGYSTLTGGLFAFALLKTKNILIPAFVHAVYNFCGLLFTGTQGLGTGSILDVPTIVMMCVVCISVGAFVLYKVWKYPETERIELYERLGFSIKAVEDNEE